MKKEVLIIGSGLTGLLLAYRLKQQGISIKILESRNRIGGRIYTRLAKGATPIEMGATWFAAQHETLISLLEELEIPAFEQFMQGIALFQPFSNSLPQRMTLPANQPPSYRIQKGTSTLINKLLSYLNPEEILLSTKVDSIRYSDTDQFTIGTSKGFYKASKIISTLPPRLLVNTITFTPSLPDNIVAIAKGTHTWMGDSIKVGISYKHSFWREQQLSGTLFSNTGPITELYDHTDHNGMHFALKGFLSSDMHLESQKSREQKVRDQLQSIFGTEAAHYLEYQETLWRNEKDTSFPTDTYITPHQNNGHVLFQKTYLDNNFYIAGTETSPEFGGYMEGAVRSAQQVYQKILNTF